MKISSLILAKFVTAVFLIGEPNMCCTATKAEHANTIEHDEDIIKNHVSVFSQFCISKLCSMVLFIAHTSCILNVLVISLSKFTAAPSPIDP